MNLIKHLEFFDPYQIKEQIHIIGVGAIGSTLAETLVRLGFEELHIYDMDTVSAHNLANQMFRFNDIGAMKVDAVEEMCKGVNPDMRIHKYPEGYWPGKSKPLKGYVFLCVDNIDLRREIVEENMYNPMVKVMFDFRMGLTEAQHYAALWSNQKHKEKLLATMQFTHDEAKAATPVSACGTSLSVVPTVRAIVAAGASNFVNCAKGEQLATMILVNSFAGILDYFHTP